MVRGFVNKLEIMKTTMKAETLDKLDNKTHVLELLRKLYLRQYLLGQNIYSVAPQATINQCHWFSLA